MSRSTTSMDHSPDGVTSDPVMHALRLHERGGPEQLVYEEAPIPFVGIGDVLLRVHALSFTPTELTWPSTWVDRRGKDRRPVIPAHEVSGVVMALGYGTTGMRIGDAVCGLADWYRDGAASEYIAMEARNLALIPSSLTHVQAAGIPMGGLTAWQALFVHGRLKAGQWVLIHGAGGGVGTVAVQLAHAAGAHVVATGHASSQQLVTELGAEVFINVDQDRFEGSVDAVDLVFDMVGGDVLHRSWSVVRLSPSWRIREQHQKGRMAHTASTSWSSRIGQNWTSSHAGLRRERCDRLLVRCCHWPMDAMPSRRNSVTRSPARLSCRSAMTDDRQPESSAAPGSHPGATRSRTIPGYLMAPPLAPVWCV